jgi:hypothetical protein
MPETPDQMSVRLIEALEASVRTKEKLSGQLKGLEREYKAFQESQEREFGTLRESFERRFAELEDEMRSMNSHLDNLLRETEITNQLLREDMEDRKTVQASRRKFEEEERTWRHQLEERKLDRQEELEDDKRNVIKKVVGEMWAVVKQPFAYLVAGIIFWLLVTHFSTPPSKIAPLLQPPVLIPEQPAHE